MMKRIFELFLALLLFSFSIQIEAGTAYSAAIDIFSPSDKNPENFHYMVWTDTIYYESSEGFRSGNIGKVTVNSKVNFKKLFNFLFLHSVVRDGFTDIQDVSVNRFDVKIHGFLFG